MMEKTGHSIVSKKYDPWTVYSRVYGDPRTRHQAISWVLVMN